MLPGGRWFFSWLRQGTSLKPGGAVQSLTPLFPIGRQEVLWHVGCLSLASWDSLLWDELQWRLWMPPSGRGWGGLSALS